MTYRKHLLLLCSFFCLQLSFAQKNSSLPNIIYMMADDMGYADLSCYGRKDYQTPNLDKLCSQGMKFMNAYATAPVCTPTRVAFFTGRYPAHLTAGLYEPIAEGPEDSSKGRAYLFGFLVRNPAALSGPVRLFWPDTGQEAEKGRPYLPGETLGRSGGGGRSAPVVDHRGRSGVGRRDAPSRCCCVRRVCLRSGAGARPEGAGDGRRRRWAP